MRMYARARACAGLAGLVVVVAGLAAALPTLHAQQAPELKQVLYNMANRLGMLRSVREVDSLMTVEVWANGTMRQVGPKELGPVTPIKAYAQIAYDFPGMRVDITRASGTPAREIQWSAERLRGTR